MSQFSLCVYTVDVLAEIECSSNHKSEWSSVLCTCTCTCTVQAHLTIWLVCGDEWGGGRGPNPTNPMYLLLALDIVNLNTPHTTVPILVIRWLHV